MATWGSTATNILCSVLVGVLPCDIVCKVVVRYQYSYLNNDNNKTEC